MALIRFDNVSFSYDKSKRVLQDVSLRIEEGEFVCVLGANGSGKSTFAKLMNALLVPDEGRVEVLGHDTADMSARFDVRSGVGLVFQNPDDQLVASIVQDDVAFGPANLGLAPGEVRNRVSRALEAVGLAGFEQRDVSTLSGGEKQRLAIAGVLAMEPRAIILDETTSMLDPAGRKAVLSLCAELNAHGLTIVMITHFVEEARHASRVVVIEEGRVVLEGKPQQVFDGMEETGRHALLAPFDVRLTRELQDRGVVLGARLRGVLCAETPSGTPKRPGVERRCGADADAARHALLEERLEAPRRLPAHPSAAGSAQAGKRAGEASGRTGESLLVFSDVSFSYACQPEDTRAKRGARTRAGSADGTLSGQFTWALSHLSFSVGHGEFFGIAGATGSGKSTLVQMCNGLLHPTSGSVALRGEDLQDAAVAKRSRCEIGVAFQYPEHQMFAPTVFEEVAFGLRARGLAEDEIGQRVDEALRAMGLDGPGLKERSPFALSGGEQRRVALAGILAVEPRALVLDEPIAGLDPMGHEDLLATLKELHGDRGLTVVLVSHDMDDLARLCDRVLVLNRGECHAIGTPDEVFADGAQLERIGLDQPRGLRIARALGVSVSAAQAADPRALADALAAADRGACFA